MSEIVRGEREDIVEQIVREELQPVVRDAITEDVLRGLADLVALTPEIVDAIAEDIRHGDVHTRQKAYTLAAKYTLGHPTLQPKDDNESGDLVVHFEMPRPDSEPEAEDAVELKVCDICHEEKPSPEFVDGSDRCVECWSAQRAAIQERFGTGAD